MSENQQNSCHFQRKDAASRLAKVQAQGIIASTESHGIEPPGVLSAAADAVKETAVLLALFWPFFYLIPPEGHALFLSFSAFLCGWIIWKAGKSARLAWSRLELLHRILEEKRWEIEHDRPQEREELKTLYEAKGFQGRLLEDLLDVLMADEDRLLKVMVQEELGLSLEVYKHPLQQGFSAGIGAAAAILLSSICFFYFSHYGLLAGSAISLAAASGLEAYHQKNSIISAVVWNIGIGALASGAAYFLFEFLISGLFSQ